jgi:uncharacterized protein (TIGR03067 family)
MQGEWVPTEVIANGEPAPAETVAGLRLTIKGSEYALTGIENPAAGRFQLNQSTAPKSMDVTTDSGDRVLAIYEVSGDTLKVCHANSGGERPTEFKSTGGSDRVLAIYRRK